MGYIIFIIKYIIFILIYELYYIYGRNYVLIWKKKQSCSSMEYEFEFSVLILQIED